MTAEEKIPKRTITVQSDQSKEIDAMDQLANEWQAKYAELYDRAEKLVDALKWIVSPPPHDPDPCYHPTNIAREALAEWKKK